jgi:P pilus assembly chaperone PapD
MTLDSLFKISVLTLLLSSSCGYATGIVPETSVVIVEQSEGEGAINLKNTDTFPVLLLSTLQNTQDDNETLLVITPPTARVEAGKTQRVRFILTTKEPLKTERLKRVTFEGIPPQQKGKNEVRMTLRQNLPVIIRPAGLARDPEPWKHLSWTQNGNSITVSNPSAYVVRLSQGVQTLPDKAQWTLPNSYVLPGQTLTLKPLNNKKIGAATQVRISPATSWGYSVDTYDAPLVH